MRKSHPLVPALLVLALVGLAVFAGAAVTSCSPKSPTPQANRIVASEVVASRFELVDANNVQRAVLSVNENGTAILIMGDPKLNPLITLEARSNVDTVVALHDNAGTSRLGLRANLSGASLIFAGTQGRIRAEFGAIEENATLFLADTEGRKRIFLSAGKDDNVAIGIADQKGEPVFFVP